MATNRAIWLLALLGLVAAGCSQQPLDSSSGNEIAAPSLSRGVSDGPGAVYLMSNAAAGNEIIVFDRAPDGQLSPAGTVATGGLGTGGGLGNQASIALANHGRRLYAVNAGSNDISTFDVNGTDLQAIGSPVPSGGELPVSLTVSGDLLFVLNAGGTGNITGFHLGRDGAPSPIPNSTRPLGSSAAGAAQVAFSPDGGVLAVTEKATNTITTYMVGEGDHDRDDYHGHHGGFSVFVSDPKTFPSAGATPYGFSFDWRGDLVVSEAAGGAAGASSASSYRVNRRGELRLITGPVATTQTAACWAVVSPEGRFAFTMNTGSGTISSLTIGRGGKLALADAAAGVTGDGSAPQDAAFSRNGRFLYVRNNGGTVGVFRYDGHGGLTHIGDFGPLPAGANGMVAR
jgi:6-phosphogluconolactonase